MADLATMTYLAPSAMSGRDVTLQTGTGLGPDGTLTHPQFFNGFVEAPEQSARALLAVANVAATSYYERVDTSLLDPVVTADGERLRFESFSGCGGVYARLDILPAGLDGDLTQRGTTNVDVNPPLRRALGQVSGGAPMHLDVGPDALTVTTLDSKVVERKVKLPPRWVRGFAEAPVSAATQSLKVDISAAAARRFLRTLPRAARGGSWAVASGDSLRLTARPSRDAVHLDGLGRLRELEPLLRHATRLRVYGPDPTGHPVASTWELVLDAARLTLTLSPELHRGFSGEGGVLDALSTTTDEDAAAVLDLLAWLPGSDAQTIAFALEWTPDKAQDALVRLGTSGRVGYDLADGTYFHRELPFDPARADKDNPRLVAARKLIATGALDDRGEVVLIARDGHYQQVRRSASGLSCTCQWWALYAGTRGPCKHVLAVRLAEQSQPDQPIATDHTSDAPGSLPDIAHISTANPDHRPT